MAERPYFLEPGSYREDWRLGVGALFAPGAGVTVRPGVLHGLAVAQTATASGSVTVAAGRCVNQASSAVGGAYLETLDGTKTVDVLGANPAESSARNDLIVYESGLDTGGRVHVVKGTASATPVDPPAPAQATILARVRVKAASAYGGNEVIVAADIDDLREYTSPRGRAPLVQVFNASGTWTKPKGALAVHVRLVGGQGAGGGSKACGANEGSMGGGGGAGAYAESMLDPSALADTVAVTVGAGGVGVAGAAGGAGGQSSFGTHVVAAGGAGGDSRTASTVAFGVEGGAGGGTGTGDVVVAGGSGGPGGGFGSLGFSGEGGMSPLMGAGGSGAGRITNASAQSLPGRSGGGGACTSSTGAAAAGGNGRAGRVIVTTYFG